MKIKNCRLRENISQNQKTNKVLIEAILSNPKNKTAEIQKRK